MLCIFLQDQKIEVDVLNIPVGNDSSMLKGVALLLEKEKRSNFKSVIISRLEHCEEYINIILTKQNVIKNKIITLKPISYYTKLINKKKMKTQYTDIVLVLFIPFELT